MSRRAVLVDGATASRVAPSSGGTIHARIPEPLVFDYVKSASQVKTNTEALVKPKVMIPETSGVAILAKGIKVRVALRAFCRGETPGGCWTRPG